jgi:hypothetical protein
MRQFRGHIVGSLLFSVLFPILQIEAQSVEKEGSDSLRYCSTVFMEGDTLPEVKMDPVTIGEDRRRGREIPEDEYEELKEKVVKVYPYAKVAALLMKHYDRKLADMELEARKKLFMKKVEEDLKAEFKDEITDLTVSEGRVLMKLIDRETGDTSYEIIEELRGNVPAFFWQGVARVFGHDLKAEYDPIEDDRLVEDIVIDIESGQVEVPERRPQSDKVRKLLKEKEDRGHWWALNS